MPTLIHESFSAQALNFASGHRLFPYPEEKKDYKPPAKYLKSDHDRRGSDDTLVAQVDPETLSSEKKQKQKEDEAAAKKDSPEKGQDPNIVDFDGPDDPLNPMNWSTAKKCFVTFEICLLTFGIYSGSSIYSPGTMSVAEEFGVSETVAILGLSVYVAGYGVSPMVFGPLSEIPQFGRMPIYILTLIVFVCLQVPTALAGNIGTLLAMRFLGGFFGGPVLGTGGASIGDMWAQDVRAIPIAIWGASAVCGPTLGPTVSGFAVMANGWRWSIWELLWLSGFALLVLVLFFPETSAANILCRKARRLRRATGNDKLKSQSEIDAEGMTPRAVAFEALARPLILSFREPIVFACNLYIGLAYALLYVWLESFPLVYTGVYGFNLGEENLVFLSILIFTILTFIGVVIWNLKVYKPALQREGENLQPEIRMHLAMFGCFWLPISLFWYGWAARPSVSWAVSAVGAGLFAIGIFLLFQSILNYLGDTYGKYAASVYAGNDLVRAGFGAGFPVFATQMYSTLGIGWASSLLGFLGIAFLPIPWVLYFYGPKIRKWSKYASS